MDIFIDTVFSIKTEWCFKFKLDDVVCPHLDYLPNAHRRECFKQNSKIRANYDM